MDSVLFVLPLPSPDPLALRGELTEKAARAWLEERHAGWCALLQVALDPASRLGELAERRGLDARVAFHHLGLDLMELTQAAAEVLRTGKPVDVRRPDGPYDDRSDDRSDIARRRDSRESGAELALLLAAATDWLDAQQARHVHVAELAGQVRELAEILAHRALAIREEEAA